jgi:hypothetical protein
MKLTDIIAISGKPGLYQISANRDNGLIANALGSDKKSFYSSRQHMFTPLENITIYTETDTLELLEVFKRIKTDEKSLIDSNASNDDLRKYFVKLVPEHDQEKVYTSDIKKILKWYTTLNEFGFLVPEVIEAKETKGTSKAKGATKKAGQVSAATPKIAAPKAPVKKIEKRGSQRGN